MGLPAHKWPLRHTLSALLWVLLLAAAQVGAGCESSYTAVGKSQVWAEYSFGVLAADLPAGIRVPAVMGAADASLRHRGYSVASTSATAEEGSVRAKAPPSSGSGDVDVSARVIDAATRVKVKVGLLGDEALSRAVLADTIRRLGL